MYLSQTKCAQLVRASHIKIPKFQIIINLTEVFNELLLLYGIVVAET